MAEDSEPWGWDCPFCYEFVQRKEWTDHVGLCRDAQVALATKMTEEKYVAGPEKYCSKTSGCYWKAGHDGDCETKSPHEREHDLKDEVNRLWGALTDINSCPVVWSDNGRAYIEVTKEYIDNMHKVLDSFKVGKEVSDER